MIIAFMGIGCAGAGKSTALKQASTRFNLAYICKDDIAAELFGHPHEQSHRTAITAEADIRTKIAVQSGKPLVLDATFVDVRKRREKIALLRYHGVERVIGIYFDIPYSVTRLRNQRRQYQVPDSVLQEQHRLLAAAPPSVADGFSAVHSASVLVRVLEIELAD